jgi:Tfp pilus assembly protein PilO
MPVRLVFLLLVLLAVSAVGQGGLPQNTQNRLNAKAERRDQLNAQSAPLPEDAAAARLQVVRRDAEELSALSVSLQSDLRQLQNGLLAKDLHENLKKMEKLSKKLRRDMEP